MNGRVPERIHVYRNHHLDSTRWDGFVPRDDDIVVTTAYKAGTTWTLRILAAFVFGPGPLQVPVRDFAPWIDARIAGPIEPTLERVEAQRHRRFLKSHVAADGVPFFPQAKYIVVGRDTRDVFMSMFNHYSGYTEFMYKQLNDADRPGPEFPHCPATPREMWPRWIGEGWFDWEPDGWPFWSHHHHLATWWETRDLPNVLFVHYSDLKADPETEMRRIAAFCSFDIDEDAWPALLATVSFDAMRAEARGADDPMTMMWRGGADQFFYKGTNGRWRDVLTEDDLALYERAAATLDPDLRDWMEHDREARDAAP